MYFLRKHTEMRCSALFTIIFLFKKITSLTTLLQQASQQINIDLQKLKEKECLVKVKLPMRAKTYTFLINKKFLA